MNLTYLRYAVEVEKTGSISLAARNLYLGQPNVSKAIRELEQSLGITIFKRTPRGVLPTPKGEEFLRAARQVLAQIDDLEQRFQESGAEGASFHVATPRAAYIAQAFAGFAAEMNAANGMNVSLRETNALDAIARVAQQEFSIAVIRYDTAYENHFLTLMGERGLVGQPIWEAPCVALMGADHALARAEAVESDQLAQGVEICYGDEEVPYLSIVDARRNAAAEAEKRRIRVYEGGSQYELLRRVKDAYTWTSPVPQAVLERQRCVQRACTGAVPTFKDVLIHQREYRLKEIDKRFIACLNRVKDELAWRDY